MIKNDEIDLIINTPSGKTPRKDEVKIRSTAVERRIPILTTISGVEASIRAMRSTIGKREVTGKFANFSHASRSGIARSFSNVSGRSASRLLSTMIA